MRKPLVCTLALTLVALALAATACAPAPLPEELQKPRLKETSSSPTPASAEAAPSSGSAAGGVVASASTAPAGGGVGGEIFRTGMDESGQAVAFTGGDAQAVAPCVQCHGAGGAGGIAPDIRWINLIHSGYTPANVERAITQGVDQKGKPLDRRMPHFSMSKEDLASLVAYLKALE